MNKDETFEKITWEEYTCITNRITSSFQVKHSYNIAMYTITIAIIGFAVETKNAWLFLLPYIVLFSFHRIIQNERYRINKYDAFLAVYSDDVWEQGYKEFHDNLKKTYTVHTHGITTSKLVRVSALHLGLVCSMMSIFMRAYNLVCTGEGYDLNLLVKNCTLGDVFLLVAALGLLVLMFFWCKNANDSIATREKYIRQIKLQLLKENRNCE